MADMDRAALQKLVYQKLADREFRERLTAHAPDQTHPITVVMREDSVLSMLSQLEAVGGSSNIVIPILNGFLVVAMRAGDTPQRAGDPEPVKLTQDCTVGLFAERLMIDGSSGADIVYQFMPSESGTPQRGRAELVALGG